MPQGYWPRLFRADPDSDPWQLRFLLIWVLFPPALILLLSLARPLFLGRYFIFCLPPLEILAAAGLARLQKNWLVTVSLTAMLLLSVQGVFSYYDHDFDLERDDSQSATNYILDHAQPGDAILFHIAEARVPYEFFRSVRREGASIDRDLGAPDIVYPRHGDHLDYRDFTGKPTVDLVHAAAGRSSRVWLVLMSNGSPGHPDASTVMLDETLEESCRLVEVTRFAEVEVRLYDKR
jgi:hypothetical protein